MASIHRPGVAILRDLRQRGLSKQAAVAVVGEKWSAALTVRLTGRANDIGIGSASLVFVLALVLALMAEALR